MNAMSDLSADPGQISAVQHHALIRAHPLLPVRESSAFDIDFLGTRTRHTFPRGISEPPRSDSSRLVTPAYPPFDEEYFEWLDVLESVEEAADTYVIVELGAGYGRWCMRAASAVQRRPGLRVRCVALEAEPDHLRWLLMHFRDNGVDPSDHDVMWAAVGATPGFVPFRIGGADDWYGQRIAPATTTPPPGVREGRRLKVRAVLARPPVTTSSELATMWVPCVTLAEALAGYARIDLLDIDVQHTEVDVLVPMMDLLTDRVRRIHIGTHHEQLEIELREAFTSYGWTSVHDYPSHQRCRTPYGEIAFCDGVQTWINPRCARSAGRKRRRPRVVALTSRVNRLEERNRMLRRQRAALRARCASLEQKVARLKAPRRPVWFSLLRLLTRRGRPQA